MNQWCQQVKEGGKGRRLHKEQENIALQGNILAQRDGERERKDNNSIGLTISELGTGWQSGKVCAVLAVQSTRVPGVMINGFFM